ncbi:MAG: GIY-YIG nuclease family protein [Candidatus Gracilibacteria bacterium]|jgi:hypothetical protein
MPTRKEIIRQYKQTIQPMGIYQIRNLSNDKIFIDSSKNLNGAKNRFRFQLELGRHINSSLQDEYTAFGKDKFVFEIVDQLSPKEDLTYDYTKDLETLKSLWMEKLQPFNEKGYHSPAELTK